MLTEAQVAARERQRAQDAGMAYEGDPDGPRVRNIYELLGDRPRYPVEHARLTMPIRDWLKLVEIQLEYYEHTAGYWRAELGDAVTVIQMLLPPPWYRRLWRWVRRRG